MADFSARPVWMIFPKISIEANPEHAPEKEIISGEFGISNTFDYDEKEQELHANISFKSEDHPHYNPEYNIHLNLYAVFKLSKNFHEISTPNAKELTLDIANALLGSLREMVTMLTSRGPWGAYVLPFIDAEILASNLAKSISPKSKTAKRKKKLENQ
ncbi:hypothetical protein [Pseudomonas capsici]|uniref:hypothetical protein n=1 Tax=Pseudomonas capsici TaxID=2810614 RepID=UPI0021F1CD9E|nr:hypothetical protein [Pseudomonas capsici]MCV4341076.1 hypothetical protein [Pseudomonas capsici]